MAKTVLTDAYKRVFKGGADENQMQMVMADLASFSGFYSVAGGDDNLAELNGMRKVFGRIISHLNMPLVESEALERASREESMVTQIEGEY